MLTGYILIDLNYLHSLSVKYLRIWRYSGVGEQAENPHTTEVWA